MEREHLPLLGTVTIGPAVYEIREGEDWPVAIWRQVDGRWRQVGYVIAEEVEMAEADRVPNIRLGRNNLAGLHFKLRQAIGDLIRKPDPTAVIDLEAGR